MEQLKGKRALVTGGGQGLGEAIVRRLLEAGVDVAIHYHTSAVGALALKEHAGKLGCRAEVFQADLTDEKAAAEMVSAAVKVLARSGVTHSSHSGP